MVDKLHAWKVWSASAGTEGTEFALERSSHGKAFSFAWDAAKADMSRITIDRAVLEQVLGALVRAEMMYQQPNKTLQAALRAALEQPQGEQKPAWYHKQWSEDDNIFYRPAESVPDGATPLYTHPQPKREPLTVELNTAATGAKPGTPTWLVTAAQPKREPLSTARIDELIEEGIFGGNPYELVRRLEEERGVFMTRPLTDEQVLKAVRHLYQSDFAAGMGFHGDLDVARAIEAAHGIKEQK